MLAATYARRLGIWASVALHVRGVTGRDRSILRRAFLRSPITSLHNLREWANPTVDRPCRVSSALGTFHVRPHSDDLYVTLPGREPAIVSQIRRLRKGDCFVDAGAHIGVYTVLACSVGANVIAIEMLPQNAAIVRRHIADNGCRDAVVVEAALSDTAAQRIEATAPAGKSGMASIAIDQPGDRFLVETTTLEYVLRDTPRVDLLKMDIEGAELVALAGLGGALGKVRSVIFEDGGNPQVGQWLSERGYRVTRLDARNSFAERAR